MKSVIKYPGAMCCVAQCIIAHFPPLHSYLETFFGSGAVLFSKERSNIETVNDIDDDVINLFEVLWMNFEPPNRQQRLF